MIELGRCQTDHMPRETRLCPLCKTNQVENETHFLLQCSKYSVQRQTFFNRINEIIPDIERKSTSECIKLLMNSKNYHVLRVMFPRIMFPCEWIYVIHYCYYQVKVMWLKFISIILQYYWSCFVINYTINMLLQYCKTLRSCHYALLIIFIEKAQYK